jgi:hypothetical protein
MTDPHLNPLSIILVKSGAHGGKLMFRYPIPGVPPHSGAAAQDGTARRRNPYSMVISEDLLNTRVNAEPSNIKVSSPAPPGHSAQDGQLTGFSDETLANIFAFSKSLCGSKFELKLNDVRFVGHPISLEPEETDATRRSVSGRRSTLTMFHVVFALRAVCNYSIIPCYHELSQRLGLILRHEEERAGYLSRQLELLLRAQEEAGPAGEPGPGLELAMERSHLARDIRTIYRDLCNTGEVHLYINKWVELSFCLPQKLHKKHFPGILVEPDSIYECLEALRPYHCLLLLDEAHDLLDNLSTDASPALRCNSGNSVEVPGLDRFLRRLIRQSSPLRSLRCLAVDTDLSLMQVPPVPPTPALTLLQVFQLTGHLLYWGKATVIYPLCESNLYVLSPHLPTPLPLRLRNRFAERFSGDSLLETLSEFSLPCRLAVAPPLALHQPRQIEVIVWLLQHHLVIQLHTYVSLALDQDMRLTCQQEPAPAPAPVPALLVAGRPEGSDLGSGHSEAASLSSLGSGLGRRELPGEMLAPTGPGDLEIGLAAFSPAEQAVIRRVPAASCQEDLHRFLSLCRYFRGRHHLEEVMYHENIRRSVLLQLIDKFRDILVKAEHEDPAVSMYFRSME